MGFLGVTRRRARRLRGYRTAAFLTAWLVLTMGVVFVLNIFKPGLWLERYLIVASPAVFLAVAAGLLRGGRGSVVGGGVGVLPPRAPRGFVTLLADNTLGR